MLAFISIRTVPVSRGNSLLANVLPIRVTSESWVRSVLCISGRTSSRLICFCLFYSCDCFKAQESLNLLNFGGSKDFVVVVIWAILAAMAERVSTLPVPGDWN